MNKFYHDRIETDHLIEWRQSGVKDQITRLNVETVDRNEAMERLLISDRLPRNNSGRAKAWILDKYDCSSRGWYCAGIDLDTKEKNLWGQVKFDRARKGRTQNKSVKYESPPMTSSSYYAMSVDPTTLKEITGQTELDLWDYAQLDSKLPLYVTEGSKKAGALLSRGKLALGLPGINSGYRRTPKGLQLIRPLELLSQKGRPIIFALDCNQKPKTQKATARATLNMARLLKKKGAKVSYLAWDKYKGIDDYLNNRSDFPAQLPIGNLAPVLWNRLESNSPDEILYKRFLTPDDVSYRTSRNAIAICSPKATGKTELMSQLAKQWGRPTLVISFRERLARELGNRFNLPYRQSQSQMGAQHPNGYCLCIDSLHSKANPAFDPGDWAGATIVIDEVEQTIWHLLNSATCQKNRVDILNTLTALLQVITATGGRLIVADADLSVVSIDFLNSILPDKPIWIVENRPEKSGVGADARRKLHYFDANTPDAMLQEAFNRLDRCSVTASEKMLWITGAAKVSSTYSTKSLATLFKQRYPHLKIGILDSDTDVSGDLESYLNQFDVAFASPVIESGISLESAHFDSVWLLALGTQTPESVSQALARVRSSVPRYLWANYRGLNLIGSGETNYRQILLTTERMAANNIRQLYRASKYDMFDFDCDCSAAIAWAKYASWYNFQSYYYRYFVLATLTSEYQLVKHEPGASPNYRTSLNQIKQQNIERTIAEIISGVSSPLKLQQYRNYLIETYGSTNLSFDSILLDLKGGLKRLKTLYNLCCSPPPSERSTGEARAFWPDYAKISTGDLIRVLKGLDTEQFLNQTNLFCDRSLSPWLSKLKCYRRDLKRYFNFSFGSNEAAVKVARRFLKHFLGIELTYVGKKGKRGHQERFYRGYSLDAMRKSIFEFWLRSHDSLIKG